MINENQEIKYHNNIFGVFMGLLAGGLAGAVTMLLLAPQSGRETRRQIREKGIELRDRATGIIEEAVAQVPDPRRAGRCLSRARGNPPCLR